MTDTIPSRLVFEAREERLNQLCKNLGRNDLRSDLTEAEKAEAPEHLSKGRIGRIEFKSVGATRKR